MGLYALGSLWVSMASALGSLWVSIGLDHWIPMLLSLFGSLCALASLWLLLLVVFGSLCSWVSLGLYDSCSWVSLGLYGSRTMGANGLWYLWVSMALLGLYGS